MGTSTPWGQSQQSTQIARGIVRYSTAGHGGVHLTRSRVECMPSALQHHLKRMGAITNKGDAWLEEDLEWAFAVLAFPSVYETDTVEVAEKTLRDWFPNAWEDLRGRKLVAGESSERDREAFLEAHKNDYLVTGAWGSWAMHVPEGMVGVVAIKGGWQKNGENVELYWLVPKSEYESRTNTFVVDPDRHQKLDVVLGASKPTTQH